MRGYKLCRWMVDTYDWQGTSTARMVERIRRSDELERAAQQRGHELVPHKNSVMGRRGIALTNPAPAL